MAIYKSHRYVSHMLSAGLLTVLVACAGSNEVQTPQKSTKQVAAADASAAVATRCLPNDCPLAVMEIIDAGSKDAAGNLIGIVGKVTDWRFDVSIELSNDQRNIALFVANPVSGMQVAKEGDMGIAVKYVPNSSSINSVNGGSNSTGTTTNSIGTATVSGGSTSSAIGASSSNSNTINGPHIKIIARDISRCEALETTGTAKCIDPRASLPDYEVTKSFAYSINANDSEYSGSTPIAQPKAKKASIGCVAGAIVGGGAAAFGPIGVVVGIAAQIATSKC